jgi:hypothetical protein
MDKTIAVTACGVRVVARQVNRLELEIDDRDFELLVTRFDENRDVLVKVRALEKQQ